MIVKLFSKVMTAKKNKIFIFHIMLTNRVLRPFNGDIKPHAKALCNKAAAQLCRIKARVIF